MKQALFTTFLLLSGLIALAAEGDTTQVRFHSKTDMTWYGNYDFRGKFPEAGKSWHRIFMVYTLGCASTGCSGWDYTTHIQYRKPTGAFDSSITRIDTSKGYPDTVWNRFEIMENYELARVITPYGTYMRDGTNGFSNAWTHRHTFDVTDYASLLHDSATIRAFYSGWSSGFSVTLDFYFIEGTPPRPVLSMQNIYGSGGGSYGYKNSPEFESKYMNPRRVFTPAGTKSARFSFVPSGHGGDNDLGAAEFYNVGMTLKVNAANAGSRRVWRDDCGKNPLWPQGGTWIFDRANWCPGTRVPQFDFEVGPLLQKGDSNTIDVDFEDYTWSGNQTPGYTISSVLWHYADWSRQNDACLEAIISPSNHEEYARDNPTCSHPEVLVRNNGGQDINSLYFSFGITGGDTQTYLWNGLIRPAAELRIALPHLSWNGFVATAQNVFWASINQVNGMTDEYLYDNRNHSVCKVPDRLPNQVVVWFRTNRFGRHNSYTFTDLLSGKVIFKKENLDSFILYKDTVTLPTGCVEFKLSDAGGDGIDWWFNKQQTGTGYCRLRDMNAKQLKNLNPDFGSELVYRFNTNWGLATATLPQRPLLLYPNPAGNLLYVDMPDLPQKPLTLRVTDLAGRTLISTPASHELMQLHTGHLPAGVYLLIAEHSGGSHVAKFVKE